jgi:hypothetical protein
MYGRVMCGTVSPPSADCESSILLLGFSKELWSMVRSSYMICGKVQESKTTNATRLVETYQSWCVYFARTCKTKQEFGYVKLDKIWEVDQSQWEELNIKRDISVNVDVFNRRFVTQFPKIALDYEVNWSRYCIIKFYSDLRCLETFLIVFKIHIPFMLDRHL